MMKIHRALAIISLLFLAACGGGGTAGSTAQHAPTTQTVNGVVADGYLKGAKVCLDINLNMKCDSGEPTGTTGDGGVYSIADVSIVALATYPIVVEVPAGAVDSERGSVATGYVLSAPAGKPEFVSPLTTLVQSRIESSGLSLTDAVASVKTQLGLATLSPLADYKPGVGGSNAEEVIAAGVAKVIATTIADNKKAIETAVGTGTSITSRQVIDLSILQVLQNLSTVVLQVKNATNNGLNVLAEDKVAGVVASSGVTVSTSDPVVLQQQLAATTATNAATTMKLIIALQGTGAASVKAIQATITLPAGVVMRADITGKPLAGVLASSGSAASGQLEGKYTPATATAPAMFTVGLITTGSLAAGDVLSITADLTSGTIAPVASSFTVVDNKLVDSYGSIVSGALLALR
jgi:hypothetical protein